MAMLLLVLSARDVLTWISFKLDQDRIAEKWCINKYKPVVSCSGKCFLDQQLTKSKDQSDLPVVPMDGPVKITYLFNTVFGSLPIPEEEFGLSNFGIRTADLLLIPKEIFHPPA